MKVFISYRREDSRHIVDRISERLKAALGGDSVFKDVDSIPLGADFRDSIEQAVGQCQVLLAVIGRNWLTVAGDKGTLRLHDEQDFVRMEIGTALSRGIPVIPLLVDEAKVPNANDLPAELAALAFRNGTSTSASMRNTPCRLPLQVDRTACRPFRLLWTSQLPPDPFSIFNLFSAG